MRIITVNGKKIWKFGNIFIVKTKQKLAIYLTISSHARECIRDLKLENISSENHVKIMTDKLNTLFLKDETTRAYLAFKEFYDHQSSGGSITEFLVKFEYLYHKLENTT